MSRSRIRLLALVMGLALGSLILLQTQYFISAGEIRREQFDQTVNKSLDRLISFLEEQENINNIDKSLGLSDDQKEQEKLRKESNKDYIDIDQKTRFYLGNNQSTLPTVSTYLNIFEKDSLVYSVNDASFHNKKSTDLSITVRRLQEQLRNKVKRKIYTLRQMASNITFSRRNLSDKISDINMQLLIKAKLEENGINNAFEYAIKDNNKLVDISDNYINQETDYRYKKRLYPNDLILSTGIIHLIFPNRDQLLFSSLIMVIPSLLATIILLIACATTIYIIFKQKRLSTIKNDFINNMTHELKTPISTISLAAQMLKDDSINNSEVMINSISNIISEESTRLTNQIEKVLQMAVFTESRLKLKQKNLNLNELVAELSGRFTLMVEDKKGNLSLDLGANNDLVYVDEVHISNIITNLLDNAVKYCKVEPQIKILTLNTKEAIILHVQDNAIGIAKKDQKLIFERFFRVPTGNVHDVKGFGLGLSYVKTIVELHGGRITVESNIDKGSTFKISIPLVKDVKYQLVK
jgi:two-component system phosphate regulon sensor histidine kinase PhoR